MGSLMAGWDSHVSDPKHEKVRRSKSSTREEIAAFWKSKKQIEEEHLRDICFLSPRSQRLNSDPFPADYDVDTDARIERVLQKNGWWISSNSAFLNEPPVIPPEGSARKYASQFHVAGGSG
ncbi:hypothetical protein M569_04910, partial [Genlisea aurea]